MGTGVLKASESQSESSIEFSANRIIQSAAETRRRFNVNAGVSTEPPICCDCACARLALLSISWSERQCSWNKAGAAAVNVRRVATLDSGGGSRPGAVYTHTRIPQHTTHAQQHSGISERLCDDVWPVAAALRATGVR